MIIKSPVVTEKTLSLYKNQKKVTFEISLTANKLEAAKELEKAFKVKVANVRIINRLGKYKYSRYSRKTNKLSDKKIAVFKLKDGSIDLFEEK